MGRKRKIAFVGIQPPPVHFVAIAPPVPTLVQPQPVPQPIPLGAIAPPVPIEEARHKLESAAGVSFSVDDLTEIDRIRSHYFTCRLVEEKLGVGYTSSRGADGVRNRTAKLLASLRKHNGSSALHHLFDDDVGYAVWYWLNSVDGRQHNRLLDARTVYVILSDPEHHGCLNLMEELLGLATIASEETRRAHRGAFDGLGIDEWPTAFSFFVNSLAAVARKHRIAVTASKPSGRSRMLPGKVLKTTYKLSRFCCLVKEVMETVPAELREHRQSQDDSAFALAVDRSLRPRRKSALAAHTGK